MGHSGNQAHYARSNVPEAAGRFPLHGGLHSTDLQYATLGVCAPLAQLESGEAVAYRRACTNPG